MQNNVIRKASNRWTKGLVMDFSPENTKNELLTNALNATLLTFNGNEMSLQNDMGNARVETAYLPDGYMPVGTCEYGGIIYIVSYNPLEDKSLIGCFPSPERNISSDELGIPDVFISKSDFLGIDKDTKELTGEILHNTLYVLLKNDKLNPGDKFIVCAGKSIYNEKLADLWVDKDDKYYSEEDKNPRAFELISNPIIALNVVSIEDSGKIVYLNSDLVKYTETNNYNDYSDTYKYHILGKMAENNGSYDLASVDIDTYRNVLSSGYSVFKSKTSGKLAILAELIMIDSYSVTHELKPRYNNGEIVEGAFDIILHTEITPEVTSDNYNIVPKLLYYYLDNSLGYILKDSLSGTTVVPLFEIVNNKVTLNYNSQFFDVSLSDVYTPTTEGTLNLSSTLGNSGKFNFPKPYTYHGQIKSYEGDLSGTTSELIYTKFTEGKYHRIDYSQITSSEGYTTELLLNYYTKDVRAKFYEYNEKGEVYIKYNKDVIDKLYTYYLRKPAHVFTDALRDKANLEKDLYELLTHPITATEEQINDTSIEKFQYQEIYSYRKATTEEIENGSYTLYKKEDDGETYTSVTGTPDPNETYYILKTETNLVSIGFEVDKETVRGTVYYYPATKTFEPASAESREKYYDFATYPFSPTPPYGCPITLYVRKEKWEYVEVSEDKLEEELKNGELYYSTNYILIPEIDKYRSSNLLFIVVPIDTFVDKKFEPREDYNYIEGKGEAIYPKDDPISLYTIADFIPKNPNDLLDEEKTEYSDVRLTSIQLPNVVYNNGLDLPFKYDYTIVPCMNYGRLLHLAVSNTVDFSKLHAFNQSNFNTWKYYVSENQLRLTFGVDIYDTYEEYKVDGLVLEFYDCWGFAGSIEIVDKKSYSGIFTKIIPLNSLKAISRKKILANTLEEDYVRNINIKEARDKDGNIIESQFTFNEKTFTVTEINPQIGWKNHLGIDVDNEQNDCGTLYSNLVYGVKAYLRRTIKGTKEFIHKRDFFLYTLPIYNDFYYTLNDFSNLTNPLLDLMLTYKIKDNSSKVPYTSDSGISNGYTPQGKQKINDYLKGFRGESSIDVIRYYKYQGTSDLYLEIGLKKEYEDLNLSYDPIINQHFTCDLKLLSDDVESSSFTVNSGVDGLTDTSQILNYNNGEVILWTEGLSNINKLEFDTEKNIKEINNSNDFYESNFIHHIGDKPILINYEFIVGYTASISDIRNTQVLATTICALCHQNEEGEYNYEDFGVYEQLSEEINADGSQKVELLSNIMFYNEGTSEKEIFGICRQIKTSGDNMLDECLSITFIESDAYEIKTAGKLNSGEPLKQLVGHIGKLTFCLPHAHGLSEVNGVNIHEGNNSPYYYGIPPEAKGKSDGDEDTTRGIKPREFLFKNPKYNLSLNTKNTINYNSEFLSTLYYKTFTGKVELYDHDSKDTEIWWQNNVLMREYTGFTGSQIATFNLKLIETMKSVYAYNPDYDSLTVNVGNITLQNYNPYFTSNLLSYNANLDFGEQTLNDFIYLGPVKFSNYLKYLSNFSKAFNGEYIKTSEITKIENLEKELEIPLPQVQFIPGYDYCGVGENYYLISPLTYNTPVPRDLEAELEFSASDNIVIKHSDGSNTFMKGTPNKKVLYGYNASFDKMILLDVTNYTINEDGVLKVKDLGQREVKLGSLEIDEKYIESIYDHNSYSFDYTFTNLDGKLVTINLSSLLNMYSNNGYLSSLAYGKNSDNEYGNAYAIEISSNTYDKRGTISIIPTLRVTSSNNKTDYTYNVVIDSIELEYSGTLLNSDLSISGGNISLTNQSYSTLSDLASWLYKSITLISNYGLTINTYNRAYMVNTDEFSNRLVLNGLSEDLTNVILMNKQNSVSFNYEWRINNYGTGDSSAYNGYYVILLFDFRIKKINFTLEQISKLESSTDLFIKTTRTTKYSNRINHEYFVLEEYKQAQLRGSSITINDLLYEPVSDGHRLFIRNNLCTYDSNLRGKLYYRALDSKEAGYWKYADTKYLNNIFFFTGPCYTEDNLKYNPEIDG